MTEGLVRTCFCSQHKSPRLHLHASAMPKSKFATHLKVLRIYSSAGSEYLFLSLFSPLNLFLIYWGDDSEDNNDAIAASSYSIV